MEENVKILVIKAICYFFTDQNASKTLYSITDIEVKHNDNWTDTNQKYLDIKIIMHLPYLLIGGKGDGVERLLGFLKYEFSDCSNVFLHIEESKLWKLCS